ncbi:MAG: hypothetical protein ACNA8S_13905 [Deferrisomatales bacterium]
MAPGRPALAARHRFLIKPRLQGRLAAGPVFALAAVLTGAGFCLQQVLVRGGAASQPFEAGWQVLPRTVPGVVVAAAGVYAVALALWVWWRHRALRRDLDGLADWLEGMARGEAAGAPPRLEDADVAALGGTLFRAACAFSGGEADLAARYRALTEALASVDVGPDRGEDSLQRVRRTWEDLREAHPPPPGPEAGPASRSL